MVSLPCLLYARDNGRWAARLPLVKARNSRSSTLRHLGTQVTQHSGTLTLVIGLVTVMSIWTLVSPQSRFGFDYNLLNLQAQGTEAVAYEMKLVDAHFTPRTAIWMPPPGTSREVINAKIAAFETLSTVETVESITTLLPAHPDATTHQLSALAPRYPQPLALAPDTAHAWQAAIDHLARAFRSIENRAFRSGRLDLLEDTRTLIARTSGLQASLADPASTAVLNRWSADFFGGFRDFIHAALRAPPPTLSAYPQSIRERYLTSDGTEAIYIMPKISIWERPALTQFITELRSVEPTITGNPVQMYETLERVRQGYTRSAAYAFIAIFLITLIDFRSIRYSLLCTASIGISLIWLFGLMSATGLMFNIANLIAVPIILGIGIDSSIHVYHRFREEGRIDGVFGDTGKAILLTNFTTILGFSGMALSRHQGLASMGQILILGLGLCVIASLVIWPVMLSRTNSKHLHPSIPSTIG